MSNEKSGASAPKTQEEKQITASEAVKADPLFSLTVFLAQHEVEPVLKNVLMRLHSGEKKSVKAWRDLVSSFGGGSV